MYLWSIEKFRFQLEAFFRRSGILSILAKHLKYTILNMLRSIRNALFIYAITN